MIHSHYNGIAEKGKATPGGVAPSFSQSMVSAWLARNDSTFIITHTCYPTNILPLGYEYCISEWIMPSKKKHPEITAYAMRTLWLKVKQVQELIIETDSLLLEFLDYRHETIEQVFRDYDMDTEFISRLYHNERKLIEVRRQCKQAINELRESSDRGLEIIRLNRYALEMQDVDVDDAVRRSIQELAAAMVYEGFEGRGERMMAVYEKSGKPYGDTSYGMYLWLLDEIRDKILE